MKKRLLSILSMIALTIFTYNVSAQITIDITNDHLIKGGWQDTSFVENGYNFTIHSAKYANDALKVTGPENGSGAGYIEWTVTTGVAEIWNQCSNRAVNLYINDVFIDTITSAGSLIVDHELVNSTGDKIKLEIYTGKQATFAANATDEIKWTEMEEGSEPTVISKNTLAAMTVYPNPAHDVIALRGNTYTEASVYSITGKLIKDLTVVNNTVRINDLHEGAYLIKAKALNSENFVARFIKE